MGDASGGDASGALRRIDAALARIETAAALRRAPAASGGDGAPLRPALETALARLDQLIAELEHQA